ncbi:unnamed protein product (macronuclear) [Paramecium tetraurelia]|uniref:Uncharacterized protein n=1 Tax=Paramecium tetraurelia TaxID=5888 RepID=A0BXU1_PARTE|nr:uncharacterized protein GSPATT00033211001 [Paramecium tetraurelia]CAK63358.1 unnamed protein product [Paramecium tetraurelia]|eukprot:XP_001430756.1 hypothetical protein (macronuclear) [Paramecium tetraurelia strain d4-2]
MEKETNYIQKNVFKKQQIKQIEKQQEYKNEQQQEQQNQQQQEENNEFNKDINFIIFDEQKLLLEHLIYIYNCDDNQINVDFNFDSNNLDTLLLQIYQILSNYFEKAQNKELQTFIYQHLILLSQNLLLLESKQYQYQKIIEEIIKIGINQCESEISSESSSEDSVQGQNPEQQQKQQSQTEKNEQKDEQKDIYIVAESKEQQKEEEQSTKQQQQDEQSTKQQQQEEQSTKQKQQDEQSTEQQKEEQSNQIPQSDLTIQSTSEQNTQPQILEKEENQKSEKIAQNDEGPKEIKVKKKKIYIQLPI